MHLKKMVSKANHYCHSCLCLIPKNSFCYADIYYIKHFCQGCYDKMNARKEVRLFNDPIDDFR